MPGPGAGLSKSIAGNMHTSLRFGELEGAGFSTSLYAGGTPEVPPWKLRRKTVSGTENVRSFEVPVGLEGGLLGVHPGVALPGVAAGDLVAGGVDDHGPHRERGARRWAPACELHGQPEPGAVGREQVAQEHDVADRTGLGQPHRVTGIPEEPALAHEAGGVGVADEEGRDRQLQLIGEPGGEELGVEAGAALDEQRADAAPG